MTDRTLIDPAKFAAGFADASASPTDTQEDVVKAAKKYLLNYLTALYLVEDFNAVEKKNFNSTTETHFEDMTFPELMKRVQQMNKYLDFSSRRKERCKASRLSRPGCKAWRGRD